MLFPNISITFVSQSYNAVRNEIFLKSGDNDNVRCLYSKQIAIYISVWINIVFSILHVCLVQVSCLSETSLDDDFYVIY